MNVLDQHEEQSHYGLTGYIRQSQLIPHIIPISPATLWRMVKAGEFPQPIKLTERCTAWRVEDVRDWMESKNVQEAKQ